MRTFYLGAALLAGSACVGGERADGTRQGTTSFARDALTRARRVPEATVAHPVRGAGAVQWAHESVSFPASSRDPFRVASTLRPDFSIALTDPDASTSPGEVVDGAWVHVGWSDGVDVVHLLTPFGAEEVRVVRRATNTIRFRQRMSLGSGVSAVRVRDGRIELVDGRGYVGLATPPVVAFDAHGVRRAVEVTVRGDVLAFELDARGLAFPVVVDPLWTTAGSMAQARQWHLSFPLNDGRALVAGGEDPDSSAASSSVEIYDPATNAWTAGPPMLAPRYQAAVTELPNGNVLVSAGYAAAALGSTAEVFDRSTLTWSAAGTLATGRHRHAAAVLPDGGVLVVNGVETSSAERWNPTTNTWSPAGFLTRQLPDAAAGPLPSGKVLVTGGRTSVGHCLAEIYDPTNGTWSLATNMNERRSGQAQLLLPNGKVLVAGGGDYPPKSAELYDEATNTWTMTPPMTAVHMGFPLVTLTNGKLLLVAGESPGADLYDVAQNAFVSAGAVVTTQLVAHHAARLPGGRAIVTGGRTNGPASAVAVLYGPAADGVACAGGSECASGFCVDGVCCNSACTAACNACDLAGSIGTCSPVGGPPRGARSCAPYANCTAGACAATCSVSADCIAGNVCSGTACAAPVDAGVMPPDTTTVDSTSAPDTSASDTQSGGVDVTTPADTMRADTLLPDTSVQDTAVEDTAPDDASAEDDASLLDGSAESTFERREVPSCGLSSSRGAAPPALLIALAALSRMAATRAVRRSQRAR